MLPDLSLPTWLIALVLGSAAQEPALEKEAKAKSTVLHLEGGAVLRVKAREREDGWEVQANGEWMFLPASQVARARGEYELLQEAKKLERALPKEDHVRRVAYADWLVAEGLYVEALKELDRVLEQAPDQADALALLARADLPLALPSIPVDEAGLESFFTGAARLSRPSREALLVQVAKAPEVPGLRPALGRELTSRSAERRSFATLTLRRLFPGSEAEGLISRAVLDAADDVRVGAALALRAFDDASVIAPALRAVGSKHAEVRANAIEALGNMSYREAVEPLFHHLVALQSGGGGNGAPRVHIFNGRQRAYVQDFDVEVASGQAIADPLINILLEGSVLDVAVIGVHEYQVANERAAVRRSLAKLTGANPGETTTAWQRWWKEHGDEWQAGATPPKAPTSPAGPG
jgi:HEAT repeat protein